MILFKIIKKEITMSEKILAYYNRPKKKTVKHLHVYFYEEDLFIVNELVNFANVENLSLNNALKELIKISIDNLQEKEFKNNI